MYSELSLTKEYSYDELTQKLTKFYRTVLSDLKATPLNQEGCWVVNGHPDASHIYIVLDVNMQKLRFMSEAQFDMPTEEDLNDNPIVLVYCGRRFEIRKISDLAKIPITEDALQRSMISMENIQDKDRLEKMLHFDKSYTVLSREMVKLLDKVTKFIGPVIIASRDEFVGVFNRLNVGESIASSSVATFKVEFEGLGQLSLNPVSRMTLTHNPLFASPVEYTGTFMKVLNVVGAIALDYDFCYYRSSANGYTLLLPIDWVDEIQKDLEEEQEDSKC